jgi:hypothetical protein
MNEKKITLRMGNYTLLATSNVRLPFDNANANRLLKQTKLALGDDLQKELGGLDLRSRMFNGQFTNPEANHLRDEFRSLFYFNEASIPLMKKGGIDRVELFDLSKDLGQQNDITKEHPKLIAKMKKQANQIYKSVMTDGPEYVTSEEQTVAKGPRENQSPRSKEWFLQKWDSLHLKESQEKKPKLSAIKEPDTDIPKLLARIDKNSLPEDYQGKSHQAYVEKVMASIKPEQRARVRQLWKAKRRLESDMANPGASFVKILNYISEVE